MPLSHNTRELSTSPLHPRSMTPAPENIKIPATHTVKKPKPITAKKPRIYPEQAPQIRTIKKPQICIVQTSKVQTIKNPVMHRAACNLMTTKGPLNLDNGQPESDNGSNSGNIDSACASMGIPGTERKAGIRVSNRCGSMHNDEHMYCHQCCNRTRHPKMRCKGFRASDRACILLYCRKCIHLWCVYCHAPTHKQ